MVSVQPVNTYPEGFFNSTKQGGLFLTKCTEENNNKKKTVCHFIWWCTVETLVDWFCKNNNNNNDKINMSCKMYSLYKQQLLDYSQVSIYV